MALKHVGRLGKNQRKVVVAYRTVPGESDNCVVVTTENLMSDEHDALIRAVESQAGQSANEFAEVMGRTQLPDGRNMLAGFHTTGRMIKVATNEVEMVPDRRTVIRLDQLNEQIAQQRGVSVEDLAMGSAPQQENTAETTASTPVQESTATEANAASTGALSDEELAAKYRSDANRLYKEAKALREQAEALVPSKKKNTKTTSDS